MHKSVTANNIFLKKIETNKFLGVIIDLKLTCLNDYIVFIMLHLAHNIAYFF